jgi:hypothetical protein
MTSIRDQINSPRLARLMLITLLAIVLLPLLAVVIFLELPLAEAYLWHLHNGNTVSVAEHSFHVPLEYRVERYKGGFDLTDRHGFFSGMSSVSIEPAPKTFSADDIEKWESMILPLLNKHGGNAMSVHVHGRKLDFICIQSSVSSAEESLMCKAVNSNVVLSTMAVGKANIAEVRSILETSN